MVTRACPAYVGVRRCQGAAIRNKSRPQKRKIGHGLRQGGLASSGVAKATSLASVLRFRRLCTHRDVLTL
jgi:hypothetical protein